jgi:putative NADH-flavin reductase
MARITVLGGTGYAGGAVVAEAQRRGHAVTAVARTPPSVQSDGVSWVAGSVLDEDLLAGVLQDSDVVVHAVSPRGDMAGKVEGVVDRLIDSTAGTGIRLGVVGGASSLLVEPGGKRLFDVSDNAPETLPEIETGLALLEQLKASPDDVDWFFVSPPESFGAWAPAEDTGAYRLSDDVLLRDADGNSNISAADLARAILDEIEHPQYRRRRFHAAH